MNRRELQLVISIVIVFLGCVTLLENVCINIFLYLDVLGVLTNIFSSHWLFLFITYGCTLAVKYTNVHLATRVSFQITLALVPILSLTFSILYNISQAASVKISARAFGARNSGYRTQNYNFICECSFGSTIFVSRERVSFYQRKWVDRDDDLA